MGDSTADILIKAFTDERLLGTLSRLGEVGLHLDAAMDEKEESVSEMIFEGQVWVATGSFENFNPRSKALQEIERRGGRTAGSVTGKTTHLLAGKGGGSKRKEAEKLGVAIVSEEEFTRLLSMTSEREDVKEEKSGDVQLSFLDELSC